VGRSCSTFFYMIKKIVEWRQNVSLSPKMIQRMNGMKVTDQLRASRGNQMEKNRCEISEVTSV
jgi:hypothetical protein